MGRPKGSKNKQPYVRSPEGEARRLAACQAAMYEGPNTDEWRAKLSDASRRRWASMSDEERAAVGRKASSAAQRAWYAKKEAMDPEEFRAMCAEMGRRLNDNGMTPEQRRARAQKAARAGAEKRKRKREEEDGDDVSKG